MEIYFVNIVIGDRSKKSFYGLILPRSVQDLGLFKHFKTFIYNLYNCNVPFEIELNYENFTNEPIR